MPSHPDRFVHLLGVVAVKQDADTVPPTRTGHLARNLEEDVRVAVSTNTPVLVSGGTAAEREKLARRIHAERNGSPHAFRVIPCSHRRSSDLETALTNGIQPGTYYLADVDALDVRMQALVCRFLERSASHTVIAATGQDLFALVDTPFSTTLFYRLNVIHLVIG